MIRYYSLYYRLVLLNAVSAQKSFEFTENDWANESGENVSCGMRIVVLRCCGLDY